MGMRYIDLRVIAEETELGEFVALCNMIQFLGEAGANRELKVQVDGDGSARLKFEVNGKPLETLKMDVNHLPKVYIGE
jgi:hypothetical protein